MGEIRIMCQWLISAALARAEDSTIQAYYGLGGYNSALTSTILSEF